MDPPSLVLLSRRRRSDNLSPRLFLPRRLLPLLLLLFQLLVILDRLPLPLPLRRRLLLLLLRRRRCLVELVIRRVNTAPSGGAGVAVCLVGALARGSGRLLARGSLLGWSGSCMKKKVSWERERGRKGNALLRFLFPVTACTSSSSFSSCSSTLSSLPSLVFFQFCEGRRKGCQLRLTKREGEGVHLYNVLQPLRSVLRRLLLRKRLKAPRVVEAARLFSSALLGERRRSRGRRRTSP
jgi:hypothetical protein